MNDAYTDTPWRERGQWWGDVYVEDHINRVVFGDTMLMRRGLLFMAEAYIEGQPEAMVPHRSGNMLDFGMLWVQSLNKYYQETGDVELLISVYPTLKAFVQFLEKQANPKY